MSTAQPLASTSTGHTESTPVEDFAILMSLDFNPEVPCNSTFCQEDLHKGPHPADWYVAITCPHCGIWDWCNERFMIYRKDRQHGEETYCSLHMVPSIEIKWWKPVRIS